MVRNSIKKKKRNDALVGWLFVSPLLIGMSLFLAFPLVYAIYISFTNASIGVTKPDFVFLANYNEAIHTEMFTRGMLNILVASLGVPIGLFIALIITNIIVSNPKIGNITKSIIFVPTICGSVAITFIWKYMYQQFGVINSFLGLFNIGPIPFLSEKWFMISMIIMGNWGGLGTSVLLLYASLRGINHQLYEAANIDGANFFQKFFKITLPAVSPTCFYILVTGISGTLQDFTRFQVMTGGSTPYYGMTPAWWIYYTTSAQGGFDYGFASAMGIMLGIFILIVSAFQFVGSKLWVSYDA